MRHVLLLLPLLAGSLSAQQEPKPYSTEELARGVQIIGFEDHSSEDPMVLVRKYDGLRVTDVVDALQALGLQDTMSMDNSIRPLWRDRTEKLEHRIYGVAVTAQYAPSNRPGAQAGMALSDFRKWHSHWYGTYAPEAFKPLLREGTVLVIDAHDIDNVGFIGSNNSLGWKTAGMAGVVTNAGCRDTDEIILERIPVYSKYTSHGTRPGRIETASINMPVVVGGVLVRPYDMVVADGDGVVVVPRELVERVADIAWGVAKGDKEGRRKLYEKSGMPLDETVK